MSEKISLRNRFIQTILRIDKEMSWYFDSHIKTNGIFENQSMLCIYGL
jgi:hypothetical protein